nr:MAG TPA: hypothetical protein [Caudoviricetes sp.]
MDKLTIISPISFSIQTLFILSFKAHSLSVKSLGIGTLLLSICENEDLLEYPISLPIASWLLATPVPISHLTTNFIRSCMVILNFFRYK